MSHVLLASNDVKIGPFVIPQGGWNDLMVFLVVSILAVSLYLLLKTLGYLIFILPEQEAEAAYDDGYLDALADVRDRNYTFYEIDQMINDISLAERKSPLL